MSKKELFMAVMKRRPTKPPHPQLNSIRQSSEVRRVRKERTLEEDSPPHGLLNEEDLTHAQRMKTERKIKEDAELCYAERM